MNCFDTIAAVSTPRGKGGIAVIRISGENAIEVGERIFSVKLSDVESNRAVYGHIYFPEADGNRTRIDDGIATVFRAPASFTGEDTVELSCHGGALITQTVLGAALASGARAATAGEFTRRAFINGKLTLDSSEALGSLLEAKSFAQMRLASSGMRGRLGESCDAIYVSLRDVCSELSAGIDFPEEDLGIMSDEELREKLAASLERAVSLAKTYTTGRAVAEGIPTVICGKTNSGKSSLYNMLVGENAAIVTDIEGTTRDVLRDTVSFGGVTLSLADTAGLRDTDDPVERIGIERAYGELERAELILGVIDSSSDVTDGDVTFFERIKKFPAYKIAILNKCDLDTNENARKLTEGFDVTLSLSAKTGEGKETLEKAISDAFIDGSIDLDNDAVVVNERQYGALVRAVECLRSALSVLDAGYETELVCSDVESAMEGLASLTGRAVSEDIVSGIFSKFCVGK